MVQNSVVSKLFLDPAVLTMLHTWSRHLYEVVDQGLGLLTQRLKMTGTWTISRRSLRVERDSCTVCLIDAHDDQDVLSETPGKRPDTPCRPSPNGTALWMTCFMGREL